ncbi:MAG: hypothetical protein LBM95_06700 [Lactobacillales bacterium]|jgi:hypothetical protein|nr:hypothetical protein [Lactobacillales bacterium]
MNKEEMLINLKMIGILLEKNIFELGEISVLRSGTDERFIVTSGFEAILALVEKVISEGEKENEE